MILSNVKSNCKTLLLPNEKERKTITLLSSLSQLLGCSLQTLDHHLAHSPGGMELHAITLQSCAKKMQSYQLLNRKKINAHFKNHRMQKKDNLNSVIRI